MRTITICLPDDKHLKLEEMAKARGIGIDRLMEEISTIALTEFDAHTRFKALATLGQSEEGLRILDRLDSALSQD